MHPILHFRVENLVLPEHLQESGTRSTASVRLCVRSASKLKTRGWTKANETHGVDVIAHGPLGHSIIWRDSTQIIKEGSDQSLRFEVYINNQKVAMLDHVVLSRLVDANDGSTKTTTHMLFKTSQNLSCPAGINAQARLIVGARIGTRTPFSLPGLKPAFTVLTCPTNMLVRHVALEVDIS